jgi:hypothetical protein
MGLTGLGTISVDGSKAKANASKKQNKDLESVEK